MKKTLMTLLALGTLVCAAESVSYTTSPDSEYTTACNRYAGWTLSLTAGFLVTQDAAGETVTLGDSDAITLTSVTIAGGTKAGSSGTTSAVYLAVYEGPTTGGSVAGKLVGISTNSLGYAENTAREFTFSGVSLTAGSQYTFRYVKSDKLASNDMNTDAGYANASALVSTQVVSIPSEDRVTEYGVLGSYSASAPSASYMADVTYSFTKAIPEPATATLSLLALAGLAARRRRR